MSDTFYFGDYWPKPTLTKSISQEGTNYDGGTLKSTFAVDPNDSNIIWQDEYVNGKWQDRWIIKTGPDQVVETADIYPAMRYQFWTSKRITAFVPGKEIKWGGTQKLGDIINEPCKISWFRSTLFTPGITGNQVVEFYDQYTNFTVADGSAQYKDVLEVIYDQTWNNKTAGARMWFARGIGIVQLSWRDTFKDTDMVKKPMVYKFTDIDPIKE